MWSIEECEAVDRVIVHCDMCLYAHQELPQEFFDETAQRFRYFGVLHLISAMFLLDRGDRPMGGFVYPILRQVNLEFLLEPIQSILESTVGRITFGELLRIVRNRLATHGDLSEQALPEAVREVRVRHDDHPNVTELTENLAVAIGDLRQNLMDLREEHCGSPSS